MRVLRLRHLGHAAAGQQGIRRGVLIQLQQRGCPQHFMRHDGIQNRLLLPGVEVQPTARRHHILAEPPFQQFRRRGRDEIQDFGRVGFQAKA